MNNKPEKLTNCKREVAPNETGPPDHVARQIQWPVNHAQRERDFYEWVEHGSDGLKHVWVSASAHAESNEVKQYKLSDIVNLICSGGPIQVNTRYGERTRLLRQNQDEVRRQFQAGVREAEFLNRLAFKRLLGELKIAVDPDRVQPIVHQPKGNQKMLFITGMIVEGREYAVREPMVYHRPTDLGKSRASEAKKMTPGVCLAGCFMPLRNKHFLVRATGLFPLDIDGVEDLAKIRARILKDVDIPLLFTSITGSGLRACVLGPVARNAADYEMLYQKIARMKSAEWGLESKIDKATFDVSRLCFVPYDPKLTFRP